MQKHLCDQKRVREARNNFHLNGRLLVNQAISHINLRPRSRSSDDISLLSPLHSVPVCLPSCKASTPHYSALQASVL
eukprot:scaffold29074_cov22-Tisochrysis_lutea.AAC.1